MIHGSAVVVCWLVPCITLSLIIAFSYVVLENREGFSQKYTLLSHPAAPGRRISLFVVYCLVEVGRKEGAMSALRYDITTQYFPVRGRTWCVAIGHPATERRETSENGNGK